MQVNFFWLNIWIAIYFILFYLFLLNTKDLILRPIILIEHEYYKHNNININKVWGHVCNEILV